VLSRLFFFFFFKNSVLTFSPGNVLDNVILSLGLTHDTAVAPVRSSAIFVACCDGTLDVSASSLYTHFSLPLVVVQRLFPIAEQLRLGMAAMASGGTIGEHAVLFKHKGEQKRRMFGSADSPISAVIQFMRCYATLAKFCPKFYLSSLFEWLIAQCVELAALLSVVVAAPAAAGAPLTYAKVRVACEWVSSQRCEKCKMSNSLELFSGAGQRGVCAVLCARAAL
jgi:hypothetical protein